MTAELTFSIGKGEAGKERLDLPPFRAYFYWRERDQLIHAADFCASELETEIARRLMTKENTATFEEALKKLRQAN